MDLVAQLRAGVDREEEMIREAAGDRQGYAIQVELTAGSKERIGDSTR